MIAERTITVSLAGIAALLLTPVVFAQQAPDFQRDIRPILSNVCFKCHGPDEKERKGGKEGEGGLRFDTEEGSRADLGGSAAVVPGHPERSELVARIASADPDEVMPPPKSGKRLTPREIELLRQWVKGGGKYTKHWSYEKPQRPALPQVQDKSWVRNGVDAFILARLEKEGLKPQPEADRHAIARRVALDLTGLPPTPAEADAFVNDKAPGAYERVVDRLLASPAYGEHWGRAWLDLARYADSAGYADDPMRTIWLYRDYVIRAFNENVPFDQFTIEQIAGDLLPNATDDQITATAFHRNTMTNSEGGTNDEEFRSAAIVDRVNTTMSVWMGTSFACAQCHTHKYDPITNQEYFRFYAFLNNTEDADRNDESPLQKVFGSEQKAMIRKLQSELEAIEARFKSLTPEVMAAAAKWARGLPAKLDWQTLHPIALKVRSGAGIEARKDGTVVVPMNKAIRDLYTAEVPFPKACSLTALRLESLPLDSLPGMGAGHHDGNFVITRMRAVVVPPGGSKGPVARFVRIELPGKARILQLAEVDIFSGGVNVARVGEATQSGTYETADAARAIDGNTSGEFAKGSVSSTTEGDERWWEVDLKSEMPLDRIVIWNRSEQPDRLKDFRVVALDANRRTTWEKAENVAPKPNATFVLSVSREIAFSEAVTDFTQEDFNEQDVIPNPAAKEVKTKPGRTRRVSERGWSVGGAAKAPHSLTLLAAQPVEVEAGCRLHVVIEQQSRHEGMTLGHFRLSTTSDPQIGVHARLPADVLEALRIAENRREAKQRDVLGRYYAEEISPEMKQAREAAAALQAKINAIAPATVPVMRELTGEKRRKTRVQLRGNYLALAEQVSEGVPAVFPPLPKDAPMNRLTLSRWLVDENNPLTARVIANRFWESIFGIGIVRTSEEFGAQGELPSHPELLDWLATELVREKWDVKKFLKLLVTSAAYRQSSKVTPAPAGRDPDNRLLARGPRFRMSAEMVRDQALAVSGLLSPKMYGPSVRPARPSMGLSAAFGGGLDWQASVGEDAHRRALYTEWRRTAPYPSMATFDAPNREVCTLRRNLTNTPLQALVTLNDPVYIEAAQALARRMTAGAATAAERAALGFRLCVTRPPTAQETARLIALHEETLAYFKQAPAKAAALATNPIGAAPAGGDLLDLAAWTTVANVLLNMDETLMKR